jgi:hypothetical protein
VFEKRTISKMVVGLPTWPGVESEAGPLIRQLIGFGIRSQGSFRNSREKEPRQTRGARQQCF